MAKKPESYSCHVAGTHLAKRQARLKRIKEPTKAALLRERKNRHDPNAIAVYVDGRRLGHVPAEISAEIVRITDAGEWMFTVPHLKVQPPGEGSDNYRADMKIEPRRPDPRYENAEHLPGGVKPTLRPARKDQVFALLAHVQAIAGSSGKFIRRAASAGLGAVRRFLMAIDGLMGKLAGGDRIVHWTIRIAVLVVILFAVAILRL